MPELPEVEHVVRTLQNIAADRLIISAELFRPKLISEIDPINFGGYFAGARINSVRRRGKFILFELSNQHTLMAHLRMTGRFMLLASDRDDPKFTHARFHFDDETRLVFQDQRHFGSMKIVETARLGETKELKALAPEPFSAEFSLEYFRERLKHSKRSLKEFLVDQTKVCGLGNIYASEAMFRARIHPQCRAFKLSSKRSALLIEMIKAVLGEAVDHSNGLLVNADNIEAGYFSGGGSWLVYGREKLPCTVCGTPISRIKQGSRSTYFCRRCQRQ